MRTGDEMNDDRIPEPLPREWLPEPSGPPKDDPTWELRARRIVRAAEPRLRRLREEGGPEPAGSAVPWWLDVERWFRPAAVLAAAAGLFLVLVGPPTAEPGAPRGSAALGAVVTGGDPAALWEATGADAHPVLALLALQEEDAP